MKKRLETSQERVGIFKFDCLHPCQKIVILEMFTCEYNPGNKNITHHLMSNSLTTSAFRAMNFLY